MHAPVLLREVIRRLQPAKGEVVADCTVGYGGHAFRLAEAVGPEGTLVGLDLDRAQLDAAARRLAKTPARIRLHHRNFADLPAVMAQEGIGAFDVIFADLGVSSMQIDTAGRGIGYDRPGPLDMRLDPTRPTTAADLLATMPPEQLSQALWELSDEPDHLRIAQWIVNQRQAVPLSDVQQLTRLVLGAKGLTENTWKKSEKSDFGRFHPAARTFQALRILVNGEMENLQSLLAVLPTCLAEGGRAGILSFQPGENRRVREAFRAGVDEGIYEEISIKPITPSQGEVYRNRRSASARFRWARKRR